MDDVVLVRGSANGGDHLETATNGQDALSVRRSPESIVIAVADGCSSQPHSEVGAQIIVHMLTNFVEQAMRKRLPLRQPRVWKHICDKLLSRMQMIADDMAGDDQVLTYLNHFFQFTLVGMAMGPEDTVFFWRGDGNYSYNGKVFTIKPKAGNKPPYLVYNLTGAETTEADSPLLDFQIAIVPTSEIKTFWVGTDGTNELLAAIGKVVNGMTATQIEDLSRDPRYRDNHSLLTRHLRMMVAGGLVRDDVALIAGERLGFTPAPVAEEEPVPPEASPAGKDPATVEVAPGAGPNSTNPAPTDTNEG